MSDTDNHSNDTDETTVVIPVNAFEPASYITSKLVGEHGLAANTNRFSASSVGRSESFPCTKKFGLDDQLIVSAPHEDPSPA